MRESRYFKPQPHPTMWLRRGPGCRRPSNPWAVGPNSPHRPAPTCRVGPQSPFSWHSLPHSGERASECNEAPGITSCTGFWSPRSAMEAMNQSGQPRNSGKRGPMQPAPLTSRGLTLEEVTCLQYSFAIKLASLSGEQGPSAPWFPTNRPTWSTLNNGAPVSAGGRQN